jgi:hypothetical protein
MARVSGGMAFGTTPRQMNAADLQSVVPRAGPGDEDMHELRDWALVESASTGSPLLAELLSELKEIKRTCNAEVRQQMQEDKDKLEALEQFSVAQEAKLRDFGLLGASRACGVEAMPTVDACSLDLLDWVPPGRLLAERALADKAAFGKFSNMMTAHWEERCKPIIAKDCKPLGKVTNKITLCRVAGMCLCGAAGLALRQFADQFRACLRSHMAKGTELRNWFEQGLLFAKVFSTGDAALWCNICFVNLTNYRLQLLRMIQVRDTVEALEAEGSGRVVVEQDPDLEKLGVQNVWKSLKGLDATDGWSLKFYRAYIAKVEVTEFIPGRVQLVEVFGLRVQHWWKPSTVSRKSKVDAPALADEDAEDIAPLEDLEEIGPPNCPDHPDFPGLEQWELDDGACG